ncbi:hypothetical protein FVR03_22950 [Pontibacter qinzhouensis]|uniref:Uncharacterized protein n=1 Tax=Pontibacter qinzhouensis TaxID=2603253 RepID=A0A5C8IMN6_9BACT|nr:hypothetical protein [Pontibacter qinzhouensis]TXK22480.1 hypothetical protein FVR03_22950 [Pontibacter qinzhouensis]
MRKISEHLLPFLSSGYIDYSILDKGSKRISVKYFEINFKLIAYSELPHLQKYSYYYQNMNEPDLLMYIRVTDAGYDALLAKYRDADECFLHLKSNLGFTLEHDT